MMKKLFAVVGVTLLLAACQEKEEVIKPVAMELSVEAAGFYCQMTVLDHEGPKAQIHLAGSPFPLWFSQVRDAVAFTRLPEESKDYVAIYVNDMDNAVSWEQPGNNNWVDADAAYFVIESTQNGGMGAPEAIPFGTQAGAKKFSSENGGKVVKLTEIPDEYVLKPVEFELSDASSN
ncbi:MULTISPECIES: nitrous oxide reductase accessory protein NosL [unclassified Pseudovibrio]|uniref:nitrous oxide reductase accessory protein NosL n=1 Tax=unclassified Pseudovibrio TaxID=2627060 RepID=UPI0007AEAC29|nr:MULTISPECIES: nitrous oxide reductase accessory protein NosL [unclassified Pseudovibrio]KZK98414.1 NosL [Pseudovibrio sp. W74]KZL08260.1 NosL [Pseudovibrio sp. Ad14]